MATTESPNTLLSTSTLTVLDALCEGVISGFMLKSGAFGADPLCSTYYDDVVVRNLDGSYNYNVSGQGYAFNYTLGTSAQTGITGFQKVENIVPLSPNTRVANPPVGAGPWKPVIASFNTDTYPDADSVKLTVRVPALFAQDDNGNTNPYTISYEVDISLNNGDWVLVDAVSIQGKCTQPYLNTSAYVLPKTTPASSFYDWKVRVRRTSTNILSIRTQNELYVDTIAVVSTNMFAYPNTVLVGTQISADQFSAIPSRAYEIAGLLVNVPNGYTATQYPVTGGIVPATYPNIWLGDFKSGVWTDNPAWIFYDLLTHPIHGLGDYIQSGAVDKWTLYEIAQYCDALVDDGAGGVEPTFTCNVAIQQPDDAYSVLLNLASTFRGMLYFGNGAIHATQTSNKTPFTIFTNANAVGGQFSYSDTANNTRSTVAMVKWVDPKNGYRENVEYIEDPDGIQRYGYVEKQMTAFACTSKGQAYRLGSWTLQTERLLTETVTFQTDLEGLSVRPGDAFGVYDNFRMNRSQGGRIIGFDSGRSLITLDRPITMDPSYIYSLTALTPKFTLDGTGDLTGSNQIPLIRQAQIETFRVIQPPSTPASQLLISGSFSTGVFIGSPWVLSASGTVNQFQSATFYTCLATAEVEPGKVEVLGLVANSGINFVIATGYTTSAYPVNPGDSSAIQPPTNMTAAEITGANPPDNVFYDVIRSTWNATPSTNLSYYDFSGKTFNGSYESLSPVFNTAIDFDRTITGQYLFRVAAVSLGGVKSTYITGGYLITQTNPLGTLKPLSGIQIIEDFDPLYFTSSGYTGYIGTTPTFAWSGLLDSLGNDIVDTQFISGYRFYARSLNGVTGLFTGDISGSENTAFQFTTAQMRAMPGQPRGLQIHVDTIDFYGNVSPGASLAVNNPVMKQPFSSGFVGYNGGVIYNVTPSLQYDTSGIYLWIKQDPNFVPTYDNATFSSTNLAGTVATSFNTGSIYTWFALVDTFGRSGNAIYGPTSGNSNDVFQTFQFDISASISGAFSLLTGMITQETIARTGADYQNLLLIDGLSGQITGDPGIINTALNVRVQTATVSASGALATTIDAVSARVQLTGQTISATVGTLSSALATTGGALASWITNLGAITSGSTATVQIGAQAFVTGSVNGLGGVAIATWGFELNANGKGLSVRATSASFPGSYGKLAFSGVTLESNDFVRGSAGWQLDPSGNLECNNAVVRGAFTGGAGTAITSANSYGLKVGNPLANNTVILASNATVAGFINDSTSTLSIFALATSSVGTTTGGSLTLSKLNSNGSLSSAFDIDMANGTATFPSSLATTFQGTTTFNAASTYAAQLNVSSTNKLDFSNADSAGTPIAYLDESWGVNIRGDSTHPVHVRNASFVRAGTAGGNFGTQSILNWTIDFNPDTSWADGVLPNTFECATVGGADITFANYLKLRGPGGTTIYVPYTTTAP